MEFGVRLLRRWMARGRLSFPHLYRDFRSSRLLPLGRRVLCPDGLRQGFLPGVGHRSVALVGNGVRLSESNAPLEEQFQLHLHGVGPGFHDDELALGHTFEFIGSHERPLDHLQGLGPAVLALADGPALHGPAAQGFAQYLGSFAVGGEAAEDRQLRVIDDDFRPLLAVILLQLPQALDDGDNAQAPGPAGGEHHLGGLDLWHGAILVTVEHRPVGELPAVVIGYRQDLPVQLLDDEAHHEELRGIFFRHHQEKSGFFFAEGFGVHGCVEAQQLLHLRIQEGIEPGQGGGHDRCHGLVRCGGGGPGEPLGLVGVRQHREQHLELSLPLVLTGGHQLLDDFEHGHDVPLGWGTELRHQKDGGCEQALGGVVEELVLPEVLPLHPGGDDGLGDDLGVSLGLGFVEQRVRVGLEGVHVLAHQVQEVKPVRASGVAQVDNSHPVAIAIFGNFSVVPNHVPLRVR